MVFDLEGGLPGTLSLRICASPADLARTVAAAVREAVFGALRERGRASLVVGGDALLRGRIGWLEGLDLPWDRICLTLADERLVPADDADRNDRRLLDRLPAAARAGFVALHDDLDDDALALQARATQRLQALARPFDLVLLGLGAQGEIAALHPGARGIDAALDPRSGEPCSLLQPPAGVQPAVARLSLSLAGLLDSRRIVIAAHGLAMRDVMERAALGHWPLPSPLHALAQHAAQPVDIAWCR